MLSFPRTRQRSAGSGTEPGASSLSFLSRSFANSPSLPLFSVWMLNEIITFFHRTLGSNFSTPITLTFPSWSGQTSEIKSGRRRRLPNPARALFRYGSVYVVLFCLFSVIVCGYQVDLYSMTVKKMLRSSSQIVLETSHCFFYC